MLFTRLGRIIAVLLVAVGGLRLALGVFVAWQNDPELGRRYLGSETSGQAIDGALWMIGVGVAFGVLTDISRALRAAATVTPPKAPAHSTDQSLSD